MEWESSSRREELAGEPGTDLAFGLTSPNRAQGPLEDVSSEPIRAGHHFEFRGCLDLAELV